MMAWIRFFLTALLLLLGLFCFLSAVLGNLRFGFVMNRMHSAGIGDTLGLLCVVCALAVADGLHISVLKLILVLVFLWVGSPVMTHFLSQVEVFNNDNLKEHLRDEREEEKNGGDTQQKGGV